MRLLAHPRFHPLLRWLPFFVCWCGCQWHPLAKVTSVLHGSTGQKIEVKGESATPPKIATNETTVEIPVFTGAVITIDTSNLKLGSDKPGPVVVTTKSETIQGPANFSPPAPATPGELADGRTKIYFWVGLVVGIIAGLAGLFYRYQMVAIGGACVAAGCALGLLVQANPWIFALIGIGIVLKIAGPTLWHLVLKNRQPPPPSIP